MVPCLFGYKIGLLPSETILTILTNDLDFWGLLNPIALKMVVTLWGFDRSECNRINKG